MAGLQELFRVNHSKEYQNHVESFFSCIQRAYVVIHHRLSVRTSTGTPPRSPGARATGMSTTACRSGE